MNTESVADVKLDGDVYILKCPHCGLFVLVHRNEVNCKVFIHGVDKFTNQPVNPHMTEDECHRLASGGLIYGCGGQFFFDISNMRLIIPSTRM